MLVKIFGLALALVLAHADYDEQFTSSGAMRPAYAKFARRYSLRPLTLNAEAALEFIDSPLNDRLMILPKPLVLVNEEYALVQEGSRQRARALTRIFMAMVTPPETYNPHARRDRDLLRTLKSYRPQTLYDLYKNKSAADLNFVHGADIIRDPAGRLLTMEDNVGLIGGIGDVRGMTLHFNKMLGVRRDYLSPLTNAVEAFIKDLPPAERLKVLVLESPTLMDYASNRNLDLEPERVRREMALLGLNMRPERDLTVLISDIKSGRISHLINFSDVMDLQTTSEVKESLLELFGDGKLKLFKSPGTDVLTHKSLLIHMDQAIRDELGEEPILPTIPTLALDEELEEGEVLKRAASIGGKGVQILSRTSAQERAQILYDKKAEAEKFRDDHDSQTPLYVRQPFISTSYLSAVGPSDWVRFNVDIRALVTVVNGEPLRRPPLWGRANLRLPGVLSNITQGGFLLNVTTPNLCANLLEI